MPKINRIRIANILYDGKYIMDEIYDSYNCENMLINLKNGSGKSVLVQLMMQPMNPCIKIHDRNMESYLYSKQPSFIFIEWKLDNVSVPTYFLTGIVMKKSSADESNTSKINYFTFTNRYTDACKFDIESVPFIVHNGRSVSFESYEKCRTIIRNNVKSGTDFDYFHPDNKDHYFEKLAENGIYSNEWKTIANCNETEGGISELFKNIKTSDKLFDEWILKTIVNNLRLGNNLHETFSALIEEIDSNDEILRSKEYYERFLNDVDGYIDNLNELMEGYDATEQHQQNIADIYYFLLNSSKSTDENTEHCKDELEQIKTQTEIIRYEKLSDDYYTALNLFENQKKITENAQIDLENAQNLYNEAEKRINILNATKLYGEYKKYKGKAEAKKITLAKLIGENDNSRYNDLVFSLNHVYSALINETESQLESLVKRNMEIDKRIKKLSLEKIEITKINNVLLTEKGKLSSKIDQFEKYEQNVFKELNISLARDFLGEYDKNDILKIQTDFENNKKLINDTINAKNSEIEKLSEKITSLNNEESTLTDEKHQLDIKCLEIKNIIAEFEKAKSKAVSALKFFNLSESELYNSEINLISIDFQEKKYKKRLDEFQRDYHAKETYRSAVNNGAVHTSPEFSAILDAHNIDYETGEKYLAEEKSDKQRELLLKVNPMLPFSYIVKEKDYQCIKKTVFSENVNKAVPIITFEDIQRNISHIPKIAELDEKSMFVCLYNKECIDEERKKLYLEKLNGEMKKIEKNIGELKSKLEELSLAKKDYLSFKYDSTFLPSKNSELNETKNHIIS
ncbi:MAG: hypothetical protein LUG94_00720, partial [Ruminococcus sp.]|nr:hypothetical protein [Ruminococcus sp.]